MIVNVRNFERLLKKATLSYTIDFVQLNIDKERISSSLINNERNAIVILDVSNDVFMEVGGEHEFNFAEPNQYIIPFLSLIDEEEALFDVRRERVKLTSGPLQSTLNFSSPQTSRIFSVSEPKAGTDFFTELAIDDEFKEKFTKIKKIGTRFGKIYFTVSDGVLYIETTDKKNTYCNDLRFELQAVEKGDLVLCFDYKNLVSLMSVLDEDKEYTLALTYLDDRNMGMLYVSDADRMERYYLTSMKEI
jgi:hypothetical protein